MNNNDERDYDEERFNAGLPGDPDGEPAVRTTARAVKRGASFLNAPHTITVTCEPDGTVSLDVRQDRTGTTARFRLADAAWDGLARVAVPDHSASNPARPASRVEVSHSRAAGLVARDVYLAAVTAISHLTILTYAGQDVAAVVPWPWPDHSADIEAYLEDELSRDDSTMAEIAADVAKIATGAMAYEPPDDDEMVHAYGDPSVGALAQHGRLTPARNDDEGGTGGI